MAQTVAQLYGHLTQSQQLNKKSQIRKWRREIDHIREMVRKGRGGVENNRSLGVGTVLSKRAEEQIMVWINTLRKDGVPVSRAMLNEYVPSETINNTGTKTVWVKCAGRTKDRITLMLLADSDGNKYTSYAIFKRKDADTSEMRKENNERRHGFGKRLWEDVRLLQEKHDVQIYGNRTAWWNSDMSILFLDYHFGNRAYPEQKILLLWDDFSGHWTPEVKAKAEELNVVLVKVPPKYTYVESLQKQLLERDQGKPFRVKPPSRAKLIRWVDDVWTALSDRTITSGFSKVGLVTSSTNSNDQSANEESMLLDHSTMQQLHSARQLRTMRQDNLNETEVNDTNDSDDDGHADDDGNDDTSDGQEDEQDSE